VGPDLLGQHHVCVKIPKYMTGAGLSVADHLVVTGFPRTRGVRSFYGSVHTPMSRRIPAYETSVSVAALATVKVMPPPYYLGSDVLLRRQGTSCRRRPHFEGRRLNRALAECPTCNRWSHDHFHGMRRTFRPPEDESGLAHATFTSFKQTFSANSAPSGLRYLRTSRQPSQMADDSEIRDKARVCKKYTHGLVHTLVRGLSLARWRLIFFYLGVRLIQLGLTVAESSRARLWARAAPGAARGAYQRHSALLFFPDRRGVAVVD